MARFLRDEQLDNITVDVELLKQIVSELSGRARTMPEYGNDDPNTEHDVFLFFTIRFDQKGYRVFKIDELIDYFDQATDVERVIFQLESGTSISSNKATGSYLDLKLDKLQNSFLTVSSDNETWMDGCFAGVKEILGKHKNKNSFIRNAWVELLIQLFGVLIGFTLSLWGATKIAPFITIENSFLISFLLLLLIFSNLWAQIGLRIKLLLNYAFPSVKFYRAGKDRMHWLFQAIVGGLVVAGALFLLNWMFKFLGKMLGAFIGADA